MHLVLIAPYEWAISPSLRLCFFWTVNFLRSVWTSTSIQPWTNVREQSITVFFKEKTLFAVAAAIYHHLAAVKSPTMRQGGEEHRIIGITQAQKVADRFRYMSDTDVAEDLSNTRKRFVFLTSWQERRL